MICDTTPAGSEGNRALSTEVDRVNSIRVLLVDDHSLVRAGLRALLERIPGIEVVGEAGNGREALQKIAELSPHVVLMDVLMPELNGLDAAARAVSRFPGIRILILSMNAGQEFVVQALQSGAAGYLLKNVSPTELELAIQKVANGETYFSSAIAQQVVEACLNSNGTPTTSLQRLTQRQREILQLIAEGNSTKQIAHKLSVSVKTVETHRADLMSALSIHDVAGLTRYAIRVGLVSPAL